jgi:multicomponent Na+:H+ antiporter subunit C
MALGVLPYVLTAVVFCVGLYAIAVKKNVIKTIIGVILMHHAVNLFLVLLGYRVPTASELTLLARAAAGQKVAGAIAPIVTPDMPSGKGGITQLLRLGVDPVPQALVLTSIVIGLSVSALMVVMAVRLHEKYGTFDLTRITRLKG